MFSIYHVFDKTVVESNYLEPFTSLSTAADHLMNTVTCHGGKLTMFEVSGDRLYLEADVYGTHCVWFVAMPGVMGLRVTHDDNGTMH